MKSVEVCLSPELIHLFDLEGKTVVVVDILRATSCMTTAFAHQIKAMKPVATLAECLSLKKEGYFIAAERGGEKVEGFDIGNSPFSYMEPELRGEKVGVTTTNGTLAITKSVAANDVLIGSFLNIGSVANSVDLLGQDLIIHCAGWKGSVNAEDTLFAGALIDILSETYSPSTDDAIIAHSLYKGHKTNMLDFVLASAHAQRLKGFGIQKDIEFCLEIDKYKEVPFLAEDHLII